MTATTPTGHRSTPTAWTGWIYFAAAMLVLVGVFNVIEGLAAIFSDEVFVDTGSGVLLFDLTGWGWIHLILGLLQLITGFALLAGQVWARVAAVVFVMLSAIAQLIFLTAYPLWALLVIGLDVVVLWALIVHGDEVVETR